MPRRQSFKNNTWRYTTIYLLNCCRIRVLLILVTAPKSTQLIIHRQLLLIIHRSRSLDIVYYLESAIEQAQQPQQRSSLTPTTDANDSLFLGCDARGVLTILDIHRARTPESTDSSVHNDKTQSTRNISIFLWPRPDFERWRSLSENPTIFSGLNRELHFYRIGCRRTIKLYLTWNAWQITNWRFIGSLSLLGAELDGDPISHTSLSPVRQFYSSSMNGCHGQVPTSVHCTLSSTIQSPELRPTKDPSAPPAANN